MATIYIAGPYSANSREEVCRNVKLARDTMAKLISYGFTPICPHTMMMDIDHDYGIDYETILWHCADLVQLADAILLIGDWENSNGTLKEIDILSDDDFLSSFLKVIEWFDTSCCQKFQKNGVFIGPTVISHFIPGGSINGTNFNRSWYYNHSTRDLKGFLNGTVLDLSLIHI